MSNNNERKDEMNIEFNVTGTERKALVGAISEILGQPSAYQGAPTFAYAVAGFTIDKNGKVSHSDKDELKRLVDSLKERGYTAEMETEAETNASENEQEQSAQNAENIPQTAVEVAEQAEETLHEDSAPESEPSQLAEQPEEAQPIECGDGDTPSINDSIENEVPQTSTNESDTLTIEVPYAGFNPEKLDNLMKLVDSKAALIKRALGAENLSIAVIDGNIHFPWFTLSGIDGEVDAYTRFVSALCKLAKEQKRVTAKEKNIENDKFTMRLFLIRLGFIGAEFKTARKILLHNLSGNSSWRDGKRPDKANDGDVAENSESEVTPVSSDVPMENTEEANSCEK